MGEDANVNDQDDGTPAANIHADPGSLENMMNLFASSGNSTGTASNSDTSLSTSHESSPLLERYDAFDTKAAPVDGLRSSYRESEDIGDSFRGSHKRQSSYGGLEGDSLDAISENGKNDSYRRYSYRNPDEHNLDAISENNRGSFRSSFVRRRSSASHHRRTSSVVMPPLSEFKSLEGLLGEGDLYSSTTTNNSDKIFEDNKSDETLDSCLGHLKENAKDIATSFKKPTTYIGSLVYLIYHVVSCLSVSSVIMRPNSSVSILGLMTKTAALGTLAASPVYWYCLSRQVPALYPTVDQFMIPFLVKAAAIVDQTLADDASTTEEENDTIFLASFGVLIAIGTAMSGILILAAGIFRLVNLGAFLPYPVICGFFSYVGISTWTLAVTVDTGGHKIGEIISSGDWELVRYALLHHIPTLMVAAAMRFLGAKNPFYVSFVVAGTIILFHAFRFFTATTLVEMQEEGWFWPRDNFSYFYKSSELGFHGWTPPAPLGVPRVIFQVHWGAVQNGIPTAIAMSFLYLIRCSVDAGGLKKNISTLSRKVWSTEQKARASILTPMTMAMPGMGRRFSELVDIDGSEADYEDTCDYEIVQPKRVHVSLRRISLTYAWSQFVTAIVGGFAVTPSHSSAAMYALGADALVPQVGSVLLLLVFYLTDFQVLGYVPKPAISSMLVLSFMDTTYTWFYKSFSKTKDKMEWIVVPIIVVSAFVFDLLSAVFLGVAMSTFIFVHAFFRSGVVKFAADGQKINSTIDRPFLRSEWLEENGDRIQVLCLQNYLFFGNASSIYSYIVTLFKLSKEAEKCLLTPTSKFLILDLAMVTGLDTSAVDVFAEIRKLCKENECKLFMAGMSPNVRTILSLGGFTPDRGERSKRNLRFFGSLDSALGKAEDMLLDLHYDPPQTNDTRSSLRMERSSIISSSGFQKALEHINIEHGDSFTRQLAGLEKYTTLVELQPGEALYDLRSSRYSERGLFFIEEGILKVERDRGQNRFRRGASTYRASTSIGSSYRTSSSIGSGSTYRGDLSVRYSSFGSFESQTSPQKQSEFPDVSTGETFRLARLGEGWVVGTMEFFYQQREGIEIALDHCKLHHLPFSKIEEVESEDPGLVLQLYKLLSYLMAERQEATIGQLATLHKIMSSPACS